MLSNSISEKSRYEYGRVNQALCEAMQQFLQEYWKLLCQLEAQYRANQLGISRLLLLLKVAVSRWASFFPILLLNYIIVLPAWIFI